MPILNGSPQSNCTNGNNVLGKKGLLLPLLAMTVVTGFVDAVSYLGLGHVFTANMTGNVVLLGLALAGAPRVSIARSLTSILAFFLGGIVGGRLELALSGSTRRRHVLAAAAFEAILLCAGALACAHADVTADRFVIRVYLAILLTAAAMGLRTATVRRLAVADITTTVVTSVLASFAADSSLAGGNNLHIGRRVGSIFSMLAGAAIGTLLLRFGPAVPLMCGAVSVLAAACAYARTPFASSHSGKENT